MSNTNDSGRKHSQRGLRYEDYLCREFKNVKTSKSEAAKNLLSYLKLEKDDIKLVDAHTNIPCLPSHGDPKTDLVVIVESKNGNKRQLNISAKQSTKRSVTFHEYPASVFINVLKISDKKAIDLINRHQTDGSAKKFSLDEKKYLKDVLTSRLKIFWQWVICGMHHTGRGDQIADTIICNDKFYSFNDYEEFLLNRSRCGFGTGFAWTRQSKGKGKTIQLKGPVLSFYQK